MTSQTEFPSRIAFATSCLQNWNIFTTKWSLTHTSRKLTEALASNPATWRSLVDFCFRPHWCGKTTLRCRLEQQLWEAGHTGDGKDPGYIPVVGLEVAVADADSFRWRDYYERALRALDEPMIDDKILPDHLLPKRTDQKHRHHKVTSELRWALEQALRHRRPAAFILDEAQHFRRIAGGRRLLDQLDTIKSLANLTGITHVLIGTYELLDFAGLSAQLDRRSCEIHFPRYHIDDSEEYLAFKSVFIDFSTSFAFNG